MKKWERHLLFGLALALSGWCFASPTTAAPSGGADAVQARVVTPVDDSDSVMLAGNTHPLASQSADRGPVEPSKRLERMVLVLRRSPQQDQDLAAFNSRQHDMASPDYHHWISAVEFGRLYGPADADVAAATRWLTGQGFEIYHVNEGKLSIEFSGTVAQVQNAFQVKMHKYLVDGVEHMANDRDPRVPRALAPVLYGVASLNDFRPKSLAVLGSTVSRDLKTGKTTLLAPATKPSAVRASSSGPTPQLGYTGDDGLQHEDLTPYDFATIYNSLPLWNASTPINGTGVSIAIAGGSDISLSDVATFRQAFGLPAKAPTVIHNGADPGESGPNGDQVENSLDVEMAGAAAPGANVILVVSGNTSTSYGFELSMQYIVSNQTAPIMSASYGICELGLGSSGNALYNGIEQQGATEGISIFISSGDQGSAGCDGHNDYPDSIGLAVNGIASSPYVTAVGGTDFTWSFTNQPASTYWNSTATAQGATAKGYLPEVPWNSTCVNPLLLNVFSGYPNSESLCNAIGESGSYPDLIGISGGSGGISNCTTPSGNTLASCAGGYAKPSWQTGTGVPADGIRDLPDLSLYSSIWFDGINGSAILFCYSSSSPSTCAYTSANTITMQEIGGTSAASPYMAGVMALVLQKTGATQGLANPAFYKLAAQDNLSACNSATVTSGNSCVFYDITSGLIAQDCYTGYPDCITNTSGDELGILSGFSSTTGYDLGTGLGSVNITNLVNQWSSVVPGITVSVSPSSVAFASTMVGAGAATQTVTVKNTGSVAATFSSPAVSIAGTNASSFSDSTTCGSSLAVGASCTITVGFTPSVAGSLTATLSIADNAAGSPQTVALTGTATAAASAVTVSPSSLSFANQVVGTKSAAKTVTVTNTSSSAVAVSSISGVGGTPSSFPETNTCGTSIAANASCTISVVFSPGSAGSRSTTLTVTDAAGTQTVALTGTAVAKSAIAVSPGSLTFGSQTVGTKSAAQVVTVSNSSAAAVAISSIAESGGTPTSFPETNTCGTSIAANSSCAISVVFSPGSAGSRTTTLTLTDAAGTQTVAVSGTAVAKSAITVSPTSVAFGNQTVGKKSAAKSITVKNSGSAAVSISSIADMGGTPTSFPQTNTCGSSLAGGASCTISVIFSPGSAGSRTTTLTLTDSAGTQTVALSGTAVAP